MFQKLNLLYVSNCQCNVMVFAYILLELFPFDPTEHIIHMPGLYSQPVGTFLVSRLLRYRRTLGIGAKFYIQHFNGK